MLDANIEIRDKIARIKRNITLKAAQGMTFPDLISRWPNGGVNALTDYASARRALIVEYKKLYDADEAVERAEQALKESLDAAGQLLIDASAGDRDDQDIGRNST